MKTSPFPTLRLIFVTAILLGAVLPSHAQITVVNETGDKLPDQAAEYDFENVPYTLAFDAGAAATKLIVTLSGEIGVGGSPVVTYDGNALTRIPGTFSGVHNHGIFFLDLAGTAYVGGDADLTIDMTTYPTVNGIGFGVVSIAGSAPGYAASKVASAAAVSLNVPVADSFVVANLGVNDITSAITVPTDHTELYSGHIGSADGAASYLGGEIAGTRTYTFASSFGTNTPTTSAAAFVPVSAAPVLLSTTPADNAVNVALDANLVAKFTEPVAAGTSGNIELWTVGGGSALETFNVTSSPRLTFSSPDQTLTIDPTNNLDLGVEYYVLIDSGAVVDTTGGDSFAGISDPAVWSFTADALPSIVTLVPADDATNVAASANLVATFNETVSAGTGNIELWKVGTPSTLVEPFDVEFSSQLTFNGAKVTINPSDDLDPATEYYVLIDSGAIVDATPNDFAGISDPTAWSFTTDATAPAIATLSPTDDTVGVSIGTNLIVTFTEAVRAGDSGSVTLYKSDDTLVQSFDVTSEVVFGGLQITINPSSDLDPTTGYYVTIDAGAVEDLSGNAFAGIAGNTGWNFTTNAGTDRFTAVNRGNFGGTAPGATVTQSIDVGVGADMLVVMTSSELGNGNMTVTYGGIAMKLAGGNKTQSAIWYLDLATPGISGTNVVVDLSLAGSRNGFAAGWVSIDGNLGVDEAITVHSTGTSAAQSNTVGLTTTAVETFVVVNFNANNTSKGITVNSPNPQVIYTDNNIGSAEGAAAYASAVAAGSHTYQWTLGGLAPPAADYRRIDAAAFAVTTGTAFEDWAATGTLGSVTFDGDTNADGVQDGMAFLLGAGNPDDDASGRLPTVSEDGSGGLELTFDCLPIADRGDAKLYVGHSGDLGVSDAWLATVDQVPDATDAVSDNGVTFVVTPGSPTNRVVATIALSEAAGGKLFGRLQGTEN
jgi:methionine-rich copper-binding protein CopC